MPPLFNTMQFWFSQIFLIALLWGCTTSPAGHDAQTIDIRPGVDADPRLEIGPGTTDGNQADRRDSVPGPADGSAPNSIVDSSGPSEAPNGSTYTLIWSDEFTGPTIDTKTWNIEDMFVEKNAELEYYRPTNAFIENGALVLEAKRELFGGKPYTSGSITSQNKKTFKYGRISARIKLPAVVGMWPAFWMLGAKGNWPLCGEIDIMEAKGRLPSIVYGTAHWGPLLNGEHPNFGKTFELPSGQDITEWHEYTLEWSQGSLAWWVDDHPIYVSMNSFDPFNQDFYLILNLAVGGMFDNNREPPLPFAPQRMLVDYVRVYQREPTSK